MFLKFWKSSQAIKTEMGSKYVNNALAECFQCIWRAHYQVESVRKLWPFHFSKHLASFFHFSFVIPTGYQEQNSKILVPS